MTLLRKVAQTGAEALRNINADYYNQMADALNSIPTGSAEHAGLINCAARLIRSHATKRGPDKLERPDAMGDTEIADMLGDYRRAKADVAEIRAEMMKLAVEQFGMDQGAAKNTSLDVFFDGYLMGRGMVQKWRRVV